MININKPTNHLVYIVEDDIKHTNLWNCHTYIQDNASITIGTIMRFFAPKPYDNIIQDDVPPNKSRFALD